MMSAQYVGSIAVKAIMRVVGTVAGATVGVWLVGDYSSTPAVFLPLVFLVMAITSYKFGQLGARQVPYAYFLLGLTTLVVVTNGVATPDQAWQIGLDRTEEITVADAYIRGTTPLTRVEQIRQDFGNRLGTLKNLLQAGSRESTVFSARLSNYNVFLVSLISLFHSALYLTRSRQLDAPIVARLKNELELVTTALSEELSILTAAHRPGQPLPPSSLNEAFETLEKKVSEIRDEGFLRAQPLQTEMTFAGHFAALRSLCDELNNLRSVMEGLPRFGQPPPDPKPLWDLLPNIDWFWVKVGIKCGLVSVISVTLLMWIHPPGIASIPLMAWLLTLMSRPFIRAGGTGDLRAFQNAFGGSLALAGCAVLLLLITPFLENYLMNLTLFLVLFGLGFLTARIPGITFSIQIAFLAISSFVGLNPQQPVASQTIIDTFLGIITGMVIGTVVVRVIWPVLPQKLLRDDLLAMVADTKALLSQAPDQEKIQTRLAITSVEALQAIRQIPMPVAEAAEKSRFAALVRELQAVVARIQHLVFHESILPDFAEGLLRPHFGNLEFEFKQMLDAFAECFRQGDCRRELPTLRGALAGMDAAVEQIRHSTGSQRYEAEEALPVLDRVGRYHGIASALEECGRLMRGLEIQRYWGDYAL
jgi:uncharacterized membrane protein YccC